MPKECKYFVQHAWKRELCANCFESRQDHQRAAPCTKPFTTRDVRNVQGILRGLRKTPAVTGTRGKKKNRVVFPERLTEIIGYGGNDYDDSDNEIDQTSNDVQIIDANKLNDSKDNDYENYEDNEEDEIDNTQDTEEDKALSNLTRVNTNFNMITANLTKSPTECKPKTLGLMLGRIQKDADGNKTTLLISVTPFGADDVSVPTARRPIEKKRMDDRPIGLEKIVDMPLIASNNHLSIKKNDPSSSTPLLSCNLENESKSESKEQPSSISDAEALKNSKNIENLTDISTNSEGKNEETSIAKDNEAVDNDPSLDDLGERTVEGESEPIVDNDNEAIVEDNSREEAGVPDGKADEDDITVECDSIISAEPRRSFLHSESPVTKKPIVPPKPGVLEGKDESLSMKTLNYSNTLKVDKKYSFDGGKDCESMNTLSYSNTPKVDKKYSFDGSAEIEKLELSCVKDDDYCDQSSGNGKRRMAPKPPDANFDDTSGPLFARKPNIKVNLKSDCPVVREKEKRERATTSSSPKLKKSLGPTVSNELKNYSMQLDDAERSLSFSQYDIPSCSVNSEKFEEKKKTKSRFSLKKLLRMGGTRKDINLINSVSSSCMKLDDLPGTIQPKPRLEIIHPLELDGAAVEVLRHDKLNKCQEQEHMVNDTKQEFMNNVTVRLGKPPPPPRNGQSSTNLPSKPAARPQLSNTEDSTKTNSTSVRTWHTTTQHGNVAGDSIYANLAPENVAGEARSQLAPSKPQRTASIRRESEAIMSNNSSPRDIAATRRYEKSCLDLPVNSDSLDSTSSDSHDVYEFLSSSPECDSNLELRRHANEATRLNTTKRNSEGGVTDNYRNCKYNKTFPRSNSLPYCGSETESELNAVDGFYTGNEGAEEDHDWKTKNEDFVLSRVRQRRNRTVVHRSLEDNYGAVVIANHESLAQLLERLSQVDQTSLSPHLRALSTSNSRLKDFDIDVDTMRIIGRRAFSSASWNEQPVTICLSLDSLSSPVSHKEFCLVPIIEFVDQIPDEVPYSRFNQMFKNEDVTVSILPPYQICSMKSFLSNLPRQYRNNNSNENIMRECCLVLLQFVNALKNLQARGIEELPKSLCNFVLCKDERDSSYRLYHLQSLHVDHINDDEELVSLCQSALVALRELNLTNRLPVIRELLVRERAVSLSQVKAVLEYSLWGPSDVTLDIWKEREIVLQRWLDLERATLLHALVKIRPPLTVTDEYQLMFLVQTTSKNMCEASVLLDEQRSNLQNFQQT